MKQLLSTLLITLAFLTGTVAIVGTGVPVVHAQTATTAAGNNPTVPVPNTVGADAPAQFGTIMTWIMSLFAWLVGIAMIALNYAVYYTVVIMGTFVKNLSSVGVVWQIFRDIGNIVLIFGFLAIGITTILNVNWYGGGKKMLPMLLVVAVFLNFSLFISEAVIDVGNIFATQFYTQINAGHMPTASTLTNQGISDTIMSQLGLATIYSAAQSPTASAKLFQGGGTWYIGFMGILLFIILAFVLFSLALILITRFAVLIILIMISPIGFAGLIVPKLENTARAWWSRLFRQTITAPVLLLLLYVALRVITDVNFLTGFGSSQANQSTGWVGTQTNNLLGFGALLISFLVGMALLLFVIVAANSLGAAGARWATKLAGAATFGATAFALRSTAGAGSRYISQKVRTSRFAGTKRGRLVTATLDRGAKASFDVRGSKAWSALPYGGINAGAVAKGGYEARRAGKIKAHQDYIKSVGEAIDERGPTKADNSKVEEGKKKAAEAHKTAENKQEAVKEKVEKDRGEVGRLEAENRSNERQGIFDQKNIDDLKMAKQNLATSEADYTTVAKELAQTAKELSNAEKQTVEDIAKDRITHEKKEAQLNYAKNINGLVGLAMFGAGTIVAAKKIKDAADKKKTQTEKFVEEIEASMKKAIKDEGKNEKEKEESSKMGSVKT